MITLKQFWDSKEKLAIRCKEKWQAKKMLVSRMKFKPHCKFGLQETTDYHWNKYKDELCYSGDGGFCDKNFYEEYGHKIIEFEEIDDFNFKVGDKVRVRQWEDMVNEYGLKKGICSEYIGCDDILFLSIMKLTCGMEFIISDISRNYVLPNVNGFEIPTFALEKVYDEEEEKQEMNCKEDYEKYTLHLARCNGKQNLLSKIRKSKEKMQQFEIDFKKYFEIYKKYNNYSFRFNEERKSVTLYENGDKVQFVKPQKEDKFNWKIGLGVCFYKHLYKGNRDVEYVKGIVNEKTFFNYCVARFFEFDKDKVSTLENHVKNCKRDYCEFQLTKILNGGE